MHLFEPYLSSHMFSYFIVYYFTNNVQYIKEYFVIVKN